jgi:elongation factor Ts
MANITPKEIKELREITGAGMMECKAALIEAEGDMSKAQEILSKKSAAVAAHKATRAAVNGMIFSYIHSREDGGVGTLGVMIEVNIETDFAARNPIFKDFVKKLAMHIAAAAPIYMNETDIPADAIEKQKELFAAQLAESGKAPEFIEKIAIGKMEKWKEEVCLMKQTYSLAVNKEDAVPISEMVQGAVGKIRENIVIRRFARFELGA